MDGDIGSGLAEAQGEGEREYPAPGPGSMDSSSFEDEDKSNTSASELDAPQKVTVSWAPKEFDSGLRLQDLSKQSAQLLDPLQVRFSQMKMRHLFGDGRRVSDAVHQIETVRTSASVQKETGAAWKILAPFPLIEVIKWRCKLREEATGKAKVDSATGEDLYDTEEHWFTLDNRRLYCLQEVAAQKWPELCVCEVAVIVSGPTKHMRELRKFRTLDQGQSIAIGSKNDQVNYVRWCWRHRAGIEEKGEDESEFLELRAEGMQIERRPKVNILQMLTDVEPDSDERIQLSKRLSYILRRGASSSGFDVDENGWARIQDIITADAMQGLTMKKLLSLIEDSNRQKFRYEIRNDPKRGKLVRATGKKGVIPGAPPGKNDLNSWSQAIRQAGPPLPSKVMPPPGWFPPRPPSMLERAPPPMDLSLPPGLPTTPGASVNTPLSTTKAVTPAIRGPNASTIRAPVAPGAVKGDEPGSKTAETTNGKAAATREASAAQTKTSAKKKEKGSSNGTSTSNGSSNDGVANATANSSTADGAGAVPAISGKKKAGGKSSAAVAAACPIPAPPGIDLPPQVEEAKEAKEAKDEQPKEAKDQQKEQKEQKKEPPAAQPKQASDKKAAAKQKAAAAASALEPPPGGTKAQTAAEKKAAKVEKASSKTIRAPPLMGQGFRMPPPRMFPFGPPGSPFPLPPPMPFDLLRGEHTSAAEMAEFRRLWSGRIEMLRAQDFHRDHRQEHQAMVGWMQQELMSVRARQHMEYMSAFQQAEMAEQFEAMWNELAEEDVGGTETMEMPDWGNYDWTNQGAYDEYDKEYNYEGYDYDAELGTTMQYGNSTSSIVDMVDAPVSLEDQIRQRLEAAKVRTAAEKEKEQQRLAQEAAAAATWTKRQPRTAGSSAYTAAAVAGMTGIDDASVEAKVAAAVAAARQRSGNGVTSAAGGSGGSSAALGGRPPGNHSVTAAAGKKSGKTPASSKSEDLEARFAEVLQAAKARSHTSII